MLEVADSDGSGEVDFEEFQSIVSNNLRNELWYAAAKMVAVDAATKIQKAVARKWPRCSRLTKSASAKMSSVAAQALKQHTDAVTAAGVAAAAAQGRAIDRRLEAINSKAQTLRPVTRRDECKAATKIQAVFRGKRGRRKAKCERRERKRKQEDAAAVRIQAVYRGRKVRTNRATMLRQKKMSRAKPKRGAQKEAASHASRRGLRSRGSDAGKENRTSNGDNENSSTVRARRPLSREDWVEATDPSRGRDRLRERLVDAVQSVERTVLGRTGMQKPTPDQAVLAKIEAVRLRKAKQAEKRARGVDQAAKEANGSEDATATPASVR